MLNSTRDEKKLRRQPDSVHYRLRDSATPRLLDYQMVLLDRHRYPADILILEPIVPLNRALLVIEKFTINTEWCFFALPVVTAVMT